jgi:PilZ domain
MILSRSNSRYEVTRNSTVPGEEMPLDSSDTFTPTRRAARYPFVARAKATDLISGMQLVGLTTDLSEGGCRIATRKGPFSEGTVILLEITKTDVSFVTNATVVYNLKDQFMGIRFEEMLPDHAAILADWIKAATLVALA